MNASSPAAVRAAATRQGVTTLWVGTYPADGPDGAHGTGEGIWRIELDPVSGALSGTLAARTPAPSFLATSADGRTLYAVGETPDGSVSAFAVGDGTLELLATVSSAGSAPCHLLVDPAGRALYVTNYVSGTVGVLTLAAGGGFSHEVLAAGGPVQVFDHPGTRTPGPVPDRQDGPHAHSALLAPGGEHLLVADLGTDELRRFTVVADGLLEEDGVACVLPPGTGPRHCAVGPGDHLYVVGELAVTVSVLAWDRVTGLADLVMTLPACSTSASDGPLLPAHVSVDGDQVLVSVRGADVLSRFTAHDDGARLEHRGDTPAGGRWPRHFAVVGGRSVVAAQSSGLLVSRAAEADGPAGTLQVPSPACVVLGEP